MQSAIILLLIFIGYGLTVAFFVSRYVNNKWKQAYQAKVLKAVKEAKEKRHEIENLNDDELGERLAKFMR